MNMLLSLLSNKYVLTLVAILSFAIYVKNLHSTIEIMREDNIILQARERDLNKEVENLVLKLNNISQVNQKRVDTVTVIKDRSCARMNLINSTQIGGEVKQDVMESILPNNVISALRVSE